MSNEEKRKEIYQKLNEVQKKVEELQEEERTILEEEKRIIVSVSISSRQKKRAQWLKKHRGIIFSAIAGNAIDEIYEKEFNKKD